jgi:hypothetical protein
MLSLWNYDSSHSVHSVKLRFLNKFLSHNMVKKGHFKVVPRTVLNTLYCSERPLEL